MPCVREEVLLFLFEREGTGDRWGGRKCVKKNERNLVRVLRHDDDDDDDNDVDHDAM